MTHQNLVLTTDAINAHSKRLHKELKNRNIELSLSEAQQLLSKTFGFNNFHEMKRILDNNYDNTQLNLVDKLLKEIDNYYQQQYHPNILGFYILYRPLYDITEKRNPAPVICFITKKNDNEQNLLHTLIDFTETKEINIKMFNYSSVKHLSKEENYFLLKIINQYSLNYPDNLVFGDRIFKKINLTNNNYYYNFLTGIDELSNLENINEEYLENLEQYEKLSEKINDILNKEEISIIDDIIMSYISSIQKKTLMIIFQTQSSLKNNHHEIYQRIEKNDLHFIAQRVNDLVYSKKIMAYGNSRAVRFSELKSK